MAAWTVTRTNDASVGSGLAWSFAGFDPRYQKQVRFLPVPLTDNTPSLRGSAGEGLEKQT